MFIKKKLRQFGNYFGLNLIDALNPADLFVELMKYYHQDIPSGDQRHKFLFWTLKNLHKTNAQICQDLVVLFITGEKRGGFFVEFGATDGISLSNSYLLESEYGWKGILAEPAEKWHAALKKNRQCVIDTRCIYKTSGLNLDFTEVPIGELSTISSYINSDEHKRIGHHYKVKTISLLDLLIEHNAPQEIDYLSIDTEGSELEILSAFDFSQYEIRIISIEHNYQLIRDDIFNLLTKNGYKRILEGFSSWDDWYILDSIENKII